MPYRLDVFYDYDPERIFHRDKEAKDIAGMRQAGSGTDCNVRDLQFMFPTEERRQSAKEEFLLSGFRVEEKS